MNGVDLAVGVDRGSDLLLGPGGVDVPQPQGDDRLVLRGLELQVLLEKNEFILVSTAKETRAQANKSMYCTVKLFHHPRQ